MHHFISGGGGGGGVTFAASAFDLAGGASDSRIIKCDRRSEEDKLSHWNEGGREGKGRKKGRP